MDLGPLLSHTAPHHACINYRSFRHLNFDLSRSPKVRCDIVIGLPIIYAFLLMFNSNIWPNSALLQDIRLSNLNGLDFDLSKSLTIKGNGVIGLSIYAFLLIYISNRMSISHRLTVIATRNVFFYLLSWGPNFEKSNVH